MKLIKTAVAGTVESSDIMITIEPIESSDITVLVESSVEKQFGRHIRQLIQQTIMNLEVSGVKVIAVDQGALDCTIQARTIGAIYRAANQEVLDWKEFDLWSV